MPAKATGKWILDPEVEPTDVTKLTKRDLDAALDALQVRGYGDGRMEDVIGALVVAIVKHLKRNGFTQAVALDDSFLSDADEVPSVRNPRYPEIP